MEDRVIDIETQMASEEEKKVPMVANPELPSQAEVDRHNLTHANFKSWCM